MIIVASCLQALLVAFPLHDTSWAKVAFLLKPVGIVALPLQPCCLLSVKPDNISDNMSREIWKSSQPNKKIARFRGRFAEAPRKVWRKQ